MSVCDTTCFYYLNKDTFCEDNCLRRFQMPLTLTSNLLITNFSIGCTVCNKLPRHSKVCNIAQCSIESSWMNMQVISCAPKKIFWRDIYMNCTDTLYRHVHRYQIFMHCIMQLELHSVMNTIIVGIA